MKNYTDIKKNLEQEYNANVDQINDLTHRISILKENEIGSRTTKCLAMSLLPWVGTFFSTPYLVGTTNLPFNVVQSVSYASVLLIGTIAGLNLPFSKKRRKEFLREETVRKEEDIIKLEARCQMEKSRLINMNKAIKQVYDSICTKERLNLSTEDQNPFEEKYNAIPASLQNKITTLTSLLEQKEHQLRLVTSKKTLKNLFWRTRDSYYMYFDTIMYGFTTLGLVTASYALPGVSLSYNSAFNSDVALAGGVIAGLTGASVVTSQILHKRRIKRKVFNQLNEELGSYGLPAKSNDDDENIESTLYNLIYEIKTIKLELELTKQKMTDMISSLNQEEQPISNKQLTRKLTVEPITLELSIDKDYQQPDFSKILKKTYPSGQETI